MTKNSESAADFREKGMFITMLGFVAPGKINWIILSGNLGISIDNFNNVLSGYKH